MPVPSNTSAAGSPDADERVLLRVEGLSKEFARERSGFRKAHEHIRAVDNVSFDVYRGEAFGVVGESGCGKTTLARLILSLITPTAGSVTFDDIVTTKLDPDAMRRLRRRMQIVFQDPYSSLDPRMSVYDIVLEPLLIHGIGNSAERRQRVMETLDLVSITSIQSGRKPHEFSGGQRQRVAIARALVMHPDLIVLDEPVSALDVSIQAQVLNLLKDLQQRLALTYIFIVHDLAVAEHFCDRIAVLYLGAIMELAENRALFAHAQHPYSRALVSAAPIPDPTKERNRKRIVLTGEVTGPIGEAKGCRFEPRCPVGKGRSKCLGEEPPLRQLDTAQAAACHFPGEPVVDAEEIRGGPSTSEDFAAERKEKGGVGT